MSDSRVIGALLLALTLLGGCAPEPPRSYAANELEGAARSNSAPPSDFRVYPGRQAPVMGSIGPKPDGAVTFQIQMSSNQGGTWIDVFGSPIDVTRDFYSTTPEEEGSAGGAVEVQLRARWAFPGPAVTEWSELKIVKTAESVPSACATAMRAAASVPAESGNNNELRASLGACDNMEQWVTALYLYPQAMIYNYGSLGQIVPHDEVEAVCTSFPTTRACKNRSLGAYGDGNPNDASGTSSRDPGLAESAFLGILRSGTAAADVPGIAKVSDSALLEAGWRMCNHPNYDGVTVGDPMFIGLPKGVPEAARAWIWVAVTQELCPR